MSFYRWSPLIDYIGGNASPRLSSVQETLLGDKRLDADLHTFGKLKRGIPNGAPHEAGNQVSDKETLLPEFSFHFLNVKDGDCSIIEHGSGHVSVIDVCNAEKTAEPMSESEYRYLLEKSLSAGNFQQKKHPVNPISYLNDFGIQSIFRFILTHPDMDHMDGIKDFFGCFSPVNFWDTDNTKKMDFAGSPYNEEDWNFYRNIRDNDSHSDPKRLTLFSGSDGKYWSESEDGRPPGDSLTILAPTAKLIDDANKSGDYNDASYVLLYRASGGTILLSGDSHDKTWNHILENWSDDVKNVDLLIAPHHGRKSDRSYDFLDVVNPKITFFGNARSEHLAYAAWRHRNLEYITNNQANCMVVDCSGDKLAVFVTHEAFARSRNSETYYEPTYKAWWLKDL